MNFPPDKVHISAYYDEDGRCHSVDVTLNYDGISREDLAGAIRAVFHPDTLIVTQRGQELGSTAVIPVRRPSGESATTLANVNAAARAPGPVGRR